MPRSGDTADLVEMLRRLEKLKEKFPDEKKGGGASKDVDFNDLEDTFLRRIANVQEMINGIKKGASDTKSITEQIRQKRNVHNELEAINDIMKQMQDMIDKEKRRKKKRVTDEEISRRETNFKSFQQLLDKAQQGLVKEKSRFGEINVNRTAITREELFGSGSASLGGMQGMAARSAGIGMDSAANDSRGGGGSSGLTANQQQALIDIQKRDEEQDQIIEEIGELIREAGKIAEQINETVEIQNKLLRGVEDKIGTTQDNLTSVNVKLKKTLEAKGMSWERMCVLFFCLVFILGLVGVIVSGV